MSLVIIATFGHHSRPLCCFRYHGRSARKQAKTHGRCKRQRYYNARSWWLFRPFRFFTGSRAFCMAIRKICNTIRLGGGSLAIKYAGEKWRSFYNLIFLIYGSLKRTFVVSRSGVSIAHDLTNW